MKDIREKFQSMLTRYVIILAARDRLYVYSSVTLFVSSGSPKSMPSVYYIFIICPNVRCPNNYTPFLLH